MPEATERTVFLTPNLSLALDLVRGLAALVVVLWHAIRLNVYQGPWPWRGPFEQDAVIVFFVLSGLVITTAARQRETTLYSFAVARVARIVPTAWLAIVFAALVFLVGRIRGSHPVPMPWPNDILDIRAMILPALFLSESGAGLGPVWNPPYWSLAYEVTYYAMFASGTFAAGWKRWALLLGLSLFALPRAILLLPIWLMGVGLAVWRPESRPNPLRSVGVLVVGLTIAWLSHTYSDPISRAVVTDPDSMLRFSRHFLTDIPMGLGVALGFVALRDLSDYAAPMLRSGKRLIAVGARASFPLYLFHYPLLALQIAFGLQLRSPSAFAGEMLLIIALAVAIGELAERWRIALRSRLMQAAPAGPR